MIEDDAENPDFETSNQTRVVTDDAALQLKFMCIGEAGTGKSCLLRRFVENRFNTDTTHTIGIEFGTKVVDLGDRRVKLQIWDTAGQEKFRSVTKNYYRSACGILLVFDITSRESYNNVSRWLTDARDLAPAHAVIMLVGNKIDLDDEREVTFLEASRFAQENDLMFVETSALSGDYVEEVFMKCASTVMSKVDSGQIQPAALGLSSKQLAVADTEDLSRKSNKCKC